MRARVVREYDFITEVLPILTIGILLNMVGRYAGDQLRDYFLVRQIFLDLTGSALVAIIIGPWWAATAAIVGSVVNSQLYFNFFPFGVKNVMGSLAWGYFAGYCALRYRLAETKPTIQEALRLLIAFALVGGFACAVTTFLIKLALYPPMLRPLTFGETYQLLLRFLPFQEGNWNTDAAVLFIGDCIREVVDKIIEAAVAVLLVCVVRAVPSELSSATRYKSDAVSIFTFTVAYGFYLLAARVTQPWIGFVGAQREVEWLQYPSMIALFYMPIGVALLAFLLSTYESQSVLGRSVEGRRMARRQIYRRLVGARKWSFLSGGLPRQLLKNEALRPIIGLVGSVAAWPTATRPATSYIVNVVYFGLTAAILALYIFRNRELVREFQRAVNALGALWQWLTLRPPGSDRKLLTTLTSVVSDEHGPAHSKVLETELLTCRFIFLRRGETLDRSLASIDLITDVTACVVLIAVVGGDKVITQDIYKCLDDVFEKTSPTAVIVVSLTPSTNSELADWQIKWAHQRVRIWALNWHDLARTFAASGHVEDLGETLTQMHIRLLESQAGGGAAADSATDDLAQRALPSLARIIEDLPPRSIVYDLGAGRGRHTLFAVQKGHIVTAVDRRPDAVSDIRASLAALGEAGRGATVLQGDYMEVSSRDSHSANLVIAAGVLQHCKSITELEQRLEFMARLATEPNAMIFIEMLFDMRFDERTASDGRCNVGRSEFEDRLSQHFPAAVWTLARLAGPVRRKQNFSKGPRSFYPPAQGIESTSCEYLLSRRE